MKKIKILVSLIVCVCALFCATACGQKLGTEGTEKVEALTNAFVAGELTANNDEDKYQTDVYQTPYVEAFISKAGNNLYDTNLPFSYAGFVVKFQHGIINEQEEKMNVNGEMRFYKYDGKWNFMVEAEVATQTSENHWSAVNGKISGLNFNEYYYNGKFDASKIKEEQIDTRSVFFDKKDDVATIMESVKACLDGLNEVYSAKGYPIKKAK